MLKRNALLLALAAVLAFVACGPRPGKTADYNPSAQDYAPYVKAYTGGIVADDAVLRIDLAQDAQAQPTTGLFTLKPKVDGTTQWVSASTVLFTPESLKPGQHYKVEFALDKVLPDAPATFAYGVSVRGKLDSEQVPEEPDNGRPFRVVKAEPFGNFVAVTLSKAPANANVKGLVELKGAVRYYVQTEDNVIKVHYEGRKADLELTLDQNLKDADGETLGETFQRTFQQVEPKPAVEINLEGSILPDRNQLILPFTAVNLSAVEVRVVKIYEKNVLMYLQDNNLNSDGSGLRRAGRLVYRGDVPLDASLNLHEWNQHSIDLSGLFKKEPGAMYRITLNFRLDQSLYGGLDPMVSTSAPSGKPTAADEEEWDKTSPYWWDNYYDWEEYEWDEANDPTKPSYYMDSDRFPTVQLLASDLGLVAEYAGGNQIWVATTDLLAAKPVSGASVEVYDFQLQCIAKGKTDSKGLVQLDVEHKPFVVVAKAGGSTAYLKVTSGQERSLSRFDVGGETVQQQGIKGFVYGERGVWRPGDTMHLTLILQDKGKNLPEGHPATLEVYTPEGQFYAKQVVKGLDGFYSFELPTRADDPTGYWNAYFKVGGSTFYKTLHVETVKPNRFKITTAYPEMLQAGTVATMRVSARWLAGSPASECRTRAEVTLRKASIPFKGFEKYCFNDPSSDFTSADYIMFQGRLDGTGNGTVRMEIPETEGAPGLLQAFVVTSVEEPGGDESFTTETLAYSPYSAYVGIKVPDGDFLETDKDQPVKLAVIDAQGNRVKGHKIEYVVFKTGWSWWWDNPGGDLDSYVNGRSVSVVSSGTLTSAGNDTGFNIRVNYPDWGRYLILARDQQSGHVSGTFVTIDWPDYRGRASRRDPESLTMLTFSTDKPVYQAGEKATVFIPGAKGSQALVSLENATGVIKREWVTLSEKDTPWTFTVEPDMAPNVFVHITMVQPYGAADNDLPLRMYGVQRVKVENPDSKLEPVITLPSTLHPDEEFTIKVAEKSGKPMTYTLAIVDEGLLDLTAFKTPDPWKEMYKLEALGVKTWDLYDHVVGAFSGRFSPLASIGGDEENVVAARKDNRFNPVVLFLPPKTLDKGGDELKLKLPTYVGSVRVMLVAGHEGAYGNAEKTVPVSNPLMVVTTLPRVMGVNEETSVPVNVFAMEDGVKQASVTISADGPVTVQGPASQQLTFTEKGDKLVRFALKATGEEGVAHITVDASGSGHKASETIALTVRNPQPEIVTVNRFVLKSGEERQVPDGYVQMSGYPAPDAHAWFSYMKSYRYECSEQLSSRGLTMLNLLPLLDQEDAAQAKELIPTFITKLYSRQNGDGGFGYWPGSSSNTWVSSLAGHFLSEAKKAGFEVADAPLRNWKAYQKNMSQVFRLTGSNFFDTLDEAYRLYALAVAGDAQLSAMNRLKEATDIGERARWMLAAAYALGGKASLGEKLIDANAREFPEYDPNNYTFGTSFRDKMIAMDALALCGRIPEALEIANEPAKEYMNTQEYVFGSVAYRHLLAKVATTAMKVTVADETIENEKGYAAVEIDAPQMVKNLSDGPVYVTSVKTARTAVAKATSNGLQLEIKYISPEGAAVNPASLPQGTRFQAIVKVSNVSALRNLGNLALNFPIASGWEIQNDRLMGGASEDNYDYRDIRDDRVSWFFALPAGRSKTFSVQLRAAYEGRYMLPSVVAEAMYEPAIQAASASGIAVVTK